jgi:hypothetical protein
MKKKPVKKSAKKKATIKPTPTVGTTNHAWQIAYKAGGWSDLTSREYFAGQALNVIHHFGFDAALIAKEAVAIADAVIAELNKKTK